MQALRDEIEALKRRIAELEVENHEVKEQKVQAEKTIDQQGAQIVHLEAENADLRNKLQAVACFPGRQSSEGFRGRRRRSHICSTGRERHCKSCG